MILLVSIQKVCLSQRRSERKGIIYYYLKIVNGSLDAFASVRENSVSLGCQLIAVNEILCLN
jgi:hypothetical protein